jgi:hypothetical protein
MAAVNEPKTGEKDSFYMESNRRAHSKSAGHGTENLYLESYSGYDWGDKLSFTVGCSYVTGNMNW